MNIRTLFSPLPSGAILGPGTKPKYYNRRCLFCPYLLEIIRALGGLAINWQLYSLYIYTIVHSHWFSSGSHKVSSVHHVLAGVKSFLSFFL